MKTLSEILTEQAHRWGSKVALYFEDETYSFSELEAAANRVAAALQSVGIRKGEVVCQLLATSPQAVINIFGVLKVGAVYSPLNPSLTDEELRYQFADSQAVALITDRQGDARLDVLRTSLPALRHVLVIDEEGWISASKLKNQVEPPVDGPAPDDVAFLLYTSGSSGRPKGVLLSHRNYLASAQRLSRRLQITQNARTVHALPFFYTGGIKSLLLPFLQGASVVLRKRFDPADFWTSAHRYRPTYFIAVPTIYARLLQQPPRPDIDISCLNFVATLGAPMPLEIQQEFERCYGITMVEGYALTEGGSVAANYPDSHRRIGSVGPPLEGQEIRVLNPEGRETEIGQVGEVVVNGRTAMLGYLHLPHETARALRGGWLHTGDLGYLDSDGYLYLAGRAKDVIIRGGENISPLEVEAALYGHPAVQEAAVMGLPDLEYGEQVLAFVAPKKGAMITMEELSEHCQQRLARFKRPKQIILLPEIPKNASGKIDKPALLRQFEVAPWRI